MNPAEGCTACGLCEGRQHVVWGTGPKSKIMLVGEAPGYYEDTSGQPFVGKSGKHLDDLLGRAGLRRDQVYITNCVKCRPPQNRKPKPREAEACQDWLQYELAVVEPEVVVLMGAQAIRLAFPHEDKVGRVQGTARSCELLGRPVVAIASYHPAASVRDGSGKLAGQIVSALQRAKRQVQEGQGHE